MCWIGVPSHCKMGDRSKYLLSSSLFQLSSQGIWNSKEMLKFKGVGFCCMVHVWSHFGIMYQIRKSTVGWAQLLPQAFVSPVLNVLHPTFCFGSTSTNKDLRVHHRPCKEHYKSVDCENSMTHERQYRRLPLISNICGEQGSCWEIRCTSMAERGRMPCQKTHWYVSMGKWKLRVKLTLVNISFHFCVHIFLTETVMCSPILTDGVLPHK